MDEEVILLEEQLSAAQADIERLQQRLTESEGRMTAAEAEATELRRELAAGRETLDARESDLARLQDEIERAREGERAAATRYRELLLAHEPSLPHELVAGESIDAIDEAVSRARQTVAQVRQHLEQEAQALRVPLGAPQRSEPDLSDLTAGEKIRLGLRQA